MPELHARRARRSRLACPSRFGARRAPRRLRSRTLARRDARKPARADRAPPSADVGRGGRQGSFASRAIRSPARIEDSFRRQLEPLSAETRQLLLLAAAEPLGDPLLLSSAAAQLGLSIESADPAEEAGLFQIRERCSFRHPLVRSAVYGAATPSERRIAHGALAEATDPELDPDRKAWHRAQATPAPDEDVATELERTAVAREGARRPGRGRDLSRARGDADARHGQAHRALSCGSGGDVRSRCLGFGRAPAACDRCTPSRRASTGARRASRSPSLLGARRGRGRGDPEALGRG